MVQPMGGLPYAKDIDPATLAQFESQSNAKTQSTSDSTFSQQLAGAIEAVLDQYGNGSQYDINIKTGQGGSGFTITVTDESQGSGSTTSTSSPSSTSSTSSSSLPSSSSSSSSSTGSTPLTAAELANMTPADAYWAEQPAAVQALRYMPDDQRFSTAETLASEGYTIDVPIMVDNEDPLATMITREEYGYSWVPSALQQPVECGPGISCPGYTAYDPNHPPAGSITVSTAFALGTNLKDPCVSAADMQNYVLDQASSSTSSTSTNSSAKSSTA